MDPSRGRVLPGRGVPLPPHLAPHYPTEPACAFPRPPPVQVYCKPAPFLRVGSTVHQPIMVAYGASAPSY